MNRPVRSKSLHRTASSGSMKGLVPTPSPRRRPESVQVTGSPFVNAPMSLHQLPPLAAPHLTSPADHGNLDGGDLSPITLEFVGQDNSARAATSPKIISLPKLRRARGGRTVTHARKVKTPFLSTSRARM